MKKQTVSGSTTFLKCSQRKLCLTIGLLMLCTQANAFTFAQTGATNSAHAAQDFLPLEPGRPILRELAGGHSHSYRITLDAGQYLRVVVEQRGIDVAVVLLGPDDQPIFTFDAVGPPSPEQVTQVAESAGSYRLTVQPRQARAAAGRYEIRLLETRPATEQDRALQEARLLEGEFQRLLRANKHRDALPLAERALELREKVLPPEHPDVVAALTSLARLYHDLGYYEKAEPLYRRAIAIREKTVGKKNRAFAATLNDLARLYADQNKYAEALPLYQQTLTIWEELFGPEHAGVATLLNNLANLSRDTGDYDKAEQLHRRALAIREKIDPSHLDVALSLNNLANLYRAQGKYAEAEPLHRRALEIREKKFPPNHPDIALSLNNLGNLYHDQGNRAATEPLFQRALTILRQAYGEEHPDIAMTLNNLGIFHFDKGDYAQAVSYYRRSVTIREKLFGSDARRALAIREKIGGGEHYKMAILLDNLGNLYRARGQYAEAEAHLTRALPRKLAYLDMLSAQTDSIISLHLRAAPTHPATRDLALTTILQRKGRVLDAVMDNFAALRRRLNAQDQELLDQLQSALSQLARLALNGPQRITPAEHQSRIKSLNEEVERLQAEISQRSPGFRAQSQPVTLAAIQAAIPTRATLVEFFVYRPRNAKYTRLDEEFSAPRYVAYILREQGAADWVELGEAKEIDGAIEAWRQALRDPKRRDSPRLARAVDRLVMQPVRARLDATRRVLLSPDGALNLIPFAALVDERSRFLVERYEFSYLSSGRDLLRLQVRQPSRQPALIVANPNYGEMASERSAPDDSLKTKPDSQTSATSLAGLHFRALRGTADEARALKSPPAGARLRGLDGDVAPINLPIENPLLRSGLALAGVNLRRSGPNQDDDGVLTALEATALDLWGTKLVVLSACDTGVGEVKNGEGVYGLRRALALAGAESQVMSLWRVSDDDAPELMAAYYRALQRGQGRSAALRQAQLQTLKSRDRRHPFYWAGFIQSGEWANLQGRR
jgi:CHAT domain-containing protein/Tfp pilus assembly protein PilF